LKVLQLEKTWQSIMRLAAAEGTLIQRGEEDD